MIVSSVVSFRVAMKGVWYCKENGCDISWRAAYENCLLTHVKPIFPFYNSWKLQKTKGFLTFAGDVEIDKF